eukprot:g56474.t1
MRHRPKTFKGTVPQHAQYVLFSPFFIPRLQLDDFALTPARLTREWLYPGKLRSPENPLRVTKIREPRSILDKAGLVTVCTLFRQDSLMSLVFECSLKSCPDEAEYSQPGWCPQCGCAMVPKPVESVSFKVKNSHDYVNLEARHQVNNPLEAISNSVLIKVATSRV